jgi:lysophospholipase L1-like esterase
VQALGIILRVTRTKSRATEAPVTETNTRDWVRTWGSSPQSADALPLTADMTVRQVLRISGGGRRTRVRLSNEFGTAPLTIGTARVGVAAPGGQVRPGNHRMLTFAGRPGVTVPSGEPILSDPVDLPVDAFTELAVSLHLPERVERCTCHHLSLNTGWAIPGDATAAPRLPGSATPLPAWALVSAVDVLPDAPATAIVALGDSRVDGTGSTPGAHRSWPDVLAERLGGHAYVVNQGISGNRLLNHGLGPAGLSRFDRDALATPGLGSVIVSIGINDLAVANAPAASRTAPTGDPVTAGDVIAGHRRLIDLAHDRGVPIYATTMPPYEGHDTFSPAGDHARQEVNAWIRTSRAFDAVLDFDAVWRDPHHPSRIRDDYHSGDHLHGNDAGYRALANSIDLSLFKIDGNSRLPRG